VVPIVNLTHGFSPTLLTELRLGYDLYKIDVTDPNKTVTNASVGIADPNPFPNALEGLAQINVGSLFPTIGGNIAYPNLLTTHLSQIMDTWTKQFPNQLLKWGGDFHRYELNNGESYTSGFGGKGELFFEPNTTQLNVTSGTSPTYADSAYINAFASYLLGTPQQVSRAYLSQEGVVRQNQVEAFIQDTWHPTSNLTLDLGVREEYYSPGFAKSKGGGSVYDPSTNSLSVAGYGKVNLAANVPGQSLVEPRVGVAFRLDKRSVIRGGYAISGWTGRYGFTGGALISNFPLLTVVQQGVISGYGYSGSINSLPAITFSPIPTDGIISPAPNYVYIVPQKGGPMSYVEAWNLTYERSLMAGFTFDVGYVGNVGKHLPANIQLNVAAPGTGSAGLRYASFGRTATTTLRALQAWSNYNSLQANVSRRFAGGLSLRASYTYSKSLDLESNQGGFTDQINIARNYGPSNFDATHSLVLSHLYELPFGKGKPFVTKGVASYILSGWQLNGILRMMSGNPFTISADASSCNCPGNNQFGEQVAGVHYPHGIGPGNPWFSTASFTAPPANQFGNVSRNSVRGPDLKQYDLSLFREFHIGDLVTLQGRGEFYNVTNTPSFQAPQASVSSSTFGIISSANATQRVGQLALKLLF
jgi:hypothetical protein